MAYWGSKLNMPLNTTQPPKPKRKPSLPSTGSLKNNGYTPQGLKKTPCTLSRNNKR